MITLEENQAAVEDRNLLVRSRQELPPETSRAIMEMVTTIRVYKFINLSRQEVEAMLGITLGQTRVYQEAKEEGREEEAKLLILRQLTRRVEKCPSQSEYKLIPYLLPTWSRWERRCWISLICPI